MAEPQLIGTQMKRFHTRVFFVYVFHLFVIIRHLQSFSIFAHVKYVDLQSTEYRK